MAVETCLKLFARENDDHIRRELAQALLAQFAHEGIEIARNLLVGKELDFNEKGLRTFLLETCTFTGERFPEHDEWLATEKAEKKEHWRRIKELEGDPDRLMLFALEKLTGKKSADVATATRLSRPRNPEAKQIFKVGRNNPCPCGSGKKFKHCCMRT